MATQLQAVAITQKKFIFGVNVIVEFKYKNKEWKRGVIVSSSRPNGIIIDLEMSAAAKYKQIHLYYSTAMTYYYINKTLKPLNIAIPKQLFSIGTNIEYKYKNKEWKNGRIININANKLHETTIQIQKTVKKDKVITISRSELILNYVFKKTVKLSNIIYPFWISFDQIVKVKECSKSVWEYYNIACYRDGKSIILYKSVKDLLIIKHSQITEITNRCILTDKYEIKMDEDSNNNITHSIIYNWEIRSLSINKRKDLFCNGFIRMNYNGYITSVIVQLIACFVSDILEDIKKAQFKQPFYTIPITIKSLEFYLEFYPYGLSESYKGCFEVFLCLKSMPANIYEIKLDWKLNLKEAAFMYTPYYYGWEANHNHYCSDIFRVYETMWRRTGDRNCRQSQRKRLELEKIQHLNTLTFVFEIKYGYILGKDKKYMTFEAYYSNPILL